VAERRRLFFALWPAPKLQAAISSAALAVARQRAVGGQEVPPERVHLTLLFLGDVTAKTEEILVTGAGRVAAPSFQLTLDQAGCFYRSRVFWLGASATPNKLTLLWERLSALAAGAGVPVDARPLAPHVTCVRDIRHRIRPAPVAPITWAVRDFALVHSELGTQPRYHVVSQWRLQTGAHADVKTVQSGQVPE